MKDKILEEIEAIAKAEGECPIEDVMRRGIDALEKGLNPIELSRFYFRVTTDEIRRT